MNQPELKSKMTFDEMARVFVAKHPEFIPNRSNVGRFAKRIGFRLVKQVINYKQTYTYFNPTIKDENKKN